MAGEAFEGWALRPPVAERPAPSDTAPRKSPEAIAMGSPRVRWIGRWDRRSCLLRLFRVMWDQAGEGSSSKLSVGLRPAMLQWRRDGNGWRLVLLCVRLHLRRSF